MMQLVAPEFADISLPATRVLQGRLKSSDPNTPPEFGSEPADREFIAGDTPWSTKVPSFGLGAKIAVRTPERGGSAWSVRVLDANELMKMCMWDCSEWWEADTTPERVAAVQCAGNDASDFHALCSDLCSVTMSLFHVLPLRMAVTALAGKFSGPCQVDSDSEHENAEVPEENGASDDSCGDSTTIG